MNLGNLISELEKEPKDKLLPVGIQAPHSYRGYYDSIAFQPTKNITVGECLKAAKSALGREFRGYKSGIYKMHGYTDCYIAFWGETGEELGEVLLGFMLGRKNPWEDYFLDDA